VAILAAVQGRIELEATISAGLVKSVDVLSGPGLLVGVAKTALLKCQVTDCPPAEKFCKARVTFNFIFSPGSCDIDRCVSEFQFDFPGTATITSKRAQAIIN